MREPTTEQKKNSDRIPQYFRQWVSENFSGNKKHFIPELRYNDATTK